MHSGAFVTLGPLLHEEQVGDEGEAGEQDPHGPQHVTEEAGHLHALIFGDGTNHEVRGVPDVGHGAHEHGTGGDGGKGLGPVGHQMRGVAAGGVEEHQIGRGVVEERGEEAGQPEEHGVHGLAFVEDHVDDPGEGAVGTGAQNGDGRDHADEDADEQLGDFKDGLPRKVVQLAAFLRGQGKGSAGEGKQDDVAGGVLQLNVRAVDFKAGFGLPNAGHEHRDDNAGQKQEVDLTVKAELFIGLGGRLRLAFLAEQNRIQKEEDAEQDQGKQGGLAEQMNGTYSMKRTWTN